MITFHFIVSNTSQTLELGEAMNVHEYQAKELMRKFGIKVLNGAVAKTVDEAVEGAKKLGGNIWVKLFFVLSFVVLSSQAMSAGVLLKLSRGSGFSPFPRSTSLVITDTGEVFKQISERRLVRKVAVAQLSPVALSTLKEKIETIADDAVLINIDAKRPRCMDAPSTSLKVNKGGKETPMGENSRELIEKPAREAASSFSCSFNSRATLLITLKKEAVLCTSAFAFLIVEPESLISSSTISRERSLIFSEILRSMSALAS